MTSEEKSLILELFDEGYNTVELAERFGRHNTSIGLFLRANDRVPSGDKKHLFASDIDDMVQRYNAGEPSESIGALYNITGNTVVERLRRRGTHIRPGGIIPRKIRDDFFENIDSEVKAYFLGLLIADGSIIRPKTKKCADCLSLTLIQKDEYLLVRLCEELFVENDPVIHRTVGRTTSEIRFSSQILCDSLAKWGVVPNKTFIAYIPDIDPVLMPHLIRGIFDGDGTAFFTKGRFRFGIYGTYRLCTQMRDYLVQHCGCNNNNVFDKGTVSFVTWGRPCDIESFYNLIYTDATVWMKRKRDKFEQCLQHVNTEVNQTPKAV